MERRKKNCYKRCELNAKNKIDEECVAVLSVAGVVATGIDYVYVVKCSEIGWHIFRFSVCRCVAMSLIRFSLRKMNEKPKI